MRGKLMFIGGLAAGFVLGARAGREKYEEIAANAKKVWDHPTVQEAAGVAQAQANRLYAEGKDKLSHTKLAERRSTTEEDSKPLASSATSTVTTPTSTVTTPTNTGTTY